MEPRLLGAFPEEPPAGPGMEAQPSAEATPPMRSDSEWSPSGGVGIQPLDAETDQPEDPSGAGKAAAEAASVSASGSVSAAAAAAIVVAPEEPNHLSPASGSEFGAQLAPTSPAEDSEDECAGRQPLDADAGVPTVLDLALDKVKPQDNTGIKLTASGPPVVVAVGPGLVQEAMETLGEEIVAYLHNHAMIVLHATRLAHPVDIRRALLDFDQAEKPQRLLLTLGIIQGSAIWGARGAEIVGVCARSGRRETRVSAWSQGAGCPAS